MEASRCMLVLAVPTRNVGKLAVGGEAGAVRRKDAAREAQACAASDGVFSVRVCRRP